LPIDIHVTLLPAEGRAESAGLLGDYLSAVADGSADAPGLIAVPVRPDTAQQDWPDLDPLLPAGSAAVIAAAALTGKAGEVAEAAVRLGASSSRLLFLGLGDGSPRALRRAGAELGRRAAQGETVSTTAIAGLPDDGAQAFVTGILLGG
jgi:leucyl aminopeptidase